MTCGMCGEDPCICREVRYRLVDLQRAYSSGLTQLRLHDWEIRKKVLREVADEIAELAVDMDQEEMEGVSRDRYHALIEIGYWFEKGGLFEVRDE